MSQEKQYGSAARELCGEAYKKWRQLLPNNPSNTLWQYCSSAFIEPKMMRWFLEESGIGESELLAARIIAKLDYSARRLYKAPGYKYLKELISGFFEAVQKAPEEMLFFEEYTHRINASYSSFVMWLNHYEISPASIDRVSELAYTESFTSKKTDARVDYKFVSPEVELSVFNVSEIKSRPLRRLLEYCITKEWWEHFRYNLKRLKSLDITDYLETLTSPDSIIGSAFDWWDTPEGREYWIDVDKDVVSYYNDTVLKEFNNASLNSPVTPFVEEDYRRETNIGERFLIWSKHEFWWKSWAEDFEAKYHMDPDFLFRSEDTRKHLLSIGIPENPHSLIEYQKRLVFPSVRDGKGLGTIEKAFIVSDKLIFASEINKRLTTPCCFLTKELFQQIGLESIKGPEEHYSKETRTAIESVLSLCGLRYIWSQDFDSIVLFGDDSHPNMDFTLLRKRFVDYLLYIQLAATISLGKVSSTNCVNRVRNFLTDSHLSESVSRYLLAAFYLYSQFGYTYTYSSEFKFNNRQLTDCYNSLMSIAHLCSSMKEFKTIDKKYFGRLHVVQESKYKDNEGAQNTTAGSSRKVHISSYEVEDERKSGPQATKTTLGDSNFSKAEKWRQDSPLYQWAIEQLRKGVERKVILSEAVQLYNSDPVKYGTREGKVLTAAILSHWSKRA